MTPFSQFDTIFDPTLEATADLERCARFLDLEDWIVMRLRQCEQEITLNTATAARPLSALWVRHCTALGPAAISLQISRDVTLSSERARAIHSTWMAALYGLGYGGGAASIILDSSELNETALRDAIHRIGTSIAEVAGNAVLYPPTGAARSGGTCNLSYNHESGLADSIAFGISQLIRCAAGKLRDIRVAVQGFDPTCQSLMYQLHHAGTRIVAVADSSGGLRDPLGLDPAAIAAHQRRSGMLLGYSGAEAIVNSEVLESDCDALVLASGAHQVSPQNASRIRARVLVEVAPQAIAAPSKTELGSVGKLIVSDLLCGGLAPLYYCSEPDRTRLAVSPRPFLRRSVRHMWSQLQQAATRWQLPLRTAAEMLAVQRVAEAIRAKGI